MSKNTDHKQSVFDRLSDTKSFTGVYAERFKSGGGINNGASENHVTDLSQITRPNLRRESSSMKTGKGWGDALSTELSPSGKSRELHGVKEEKTTPKKSPSNKKAPGAATGSPSIFDRLSDPKSFTGSHKKRFEDNSKKPEPTKARH
jgi:hypothetical protein